MVRAIASHQLCLGSIPGAAVICELSFLFFALRVFLLLVLELRFSPFHKNKHF